MSSGANETGGATERALPLDVVYDLLADRRRRYTLYALFQCDGPEPISVRDLAVTVAAYEAGHTVPITGTEEYRRVARSLHHVHLPKLTDVGLIEYDREGGQVVPSESMSSLETRLDETGDLELGELCSPTR